MTATRPKQQTRGEQPEVIDKSAQIQKQSTSCRTLKNAPQSTTKHKVQGSLHTDSQGSSTSMIHHIQKCFKQVQEKDISEFNMTIFPVALSKNAYEGLDLGIKSFYQIKKKGPIGLQEIKKMVMSKGEDFGKGVKGALELLYNEPSYCQYLENYLSSSNEKEVIDLQDLTKEPTISIKSSKSHQLKKTVNTSLKSARTQRSDSRMNISPLNQFQTDRVINLTDKGICICQKQVLSLENSFICVHCGYSFHLDCMNRTQKAKHCLYCHLKMIIPNKEAKKTLFIGFLKKGRKRHEFSLSLTEEDLAVKHRLQVRCFRVKESTQNFILFPDFIDIVINNFSVKQFRPLHRQSSLKYRKDEPFYAEVKHLVPKQNRVVINEKLQAKETKDSRIEAESHIIGFFIVQEKRTDALVKQITNSSVTMFEDSKKLLNSAFIQFNGSDGVSCEVVKIPLTCTLTTQKLKIPARGLFCTHYQCFDLTNYLMMTSQSANPRWICPLCKQPSYQFKIDCILLSIIQEYAEQPLTQVMFFKNGEFSVYTGENDIKDVKIKNIHNLPIDTISKRTVVQLMPEPEKKKKKVFVMPEESKVIALDLD